MAQAQVQEKDLIDQVLEKCRSVFIYVGLFSFATNILALMLPIYSLQVLDRVLSSGSYSTLLMLSIVSVGVFIFLGLFSLIRSNVLIKLGEWLDKELYQRFLSTTLATAVMRPGTAGSQNIRDLLTLRQFLTGSGINNLFDAPWAIIFIAVIFMIHWVIGFICLIGGLTLLALTLLNEASMRKPLKEANDKTLKTMTGVDFAMRNAEVIEAMGMEKALLNRWSKQNAETVAMQSIASNRSAIVLSISKFVRMFLQVAVMSAGVWLVLDHQMTVGAVIACSILSARALAPFEASIATWSSVDAAKKSHKRLKDALRMIPVRPSSIELPKPKGILQSDKVLYAPYGSNKPILKGISFNLAAGDSLGIVGPSAAGKSTLAKLLVGIYKPNSGNVRLDSADVYTWDREQFGKHVGYLPQDVELFAGKVKENIARMREDASDEDIIKAAKMAEVHDMILHLPDGYETEIGVGGNSLSAGQRQRIGLARAFFGSPSLVVLDEPNANLDDIGEAALSRAILNAKGQKITTVVVSHRPSALKYLDYIMVMRDGLVTDFGPTKEMAAKLSAPPQAPKAVAKPPQSLTADNNAA